MRNRIKKLRNMLNLTQAEFAEKIGVSTRTIQDWEHGRLEISEHSLHRIVNTVIINALNAGVLSKEDRMHILEYIR